MKDCWILVVVLAAACGGSSSHAAAPATTDPVKTLAPEPAYFASLSGGEGTGAPPSRVPHGPRIFERLGDDGAVAGMAGWSLERVPDATYCGGLKITTMRATARVAADDQPLVEVFALAFPTELDVDTSSEDAHANHTAKDKLSSWSAMVATTSRTAQNHYLAQVASATPAGKARAIARIAQIDLRAASLLARAPIPKGVRTGPYAADTIDAFCDAMADISEPMLERAIETMATCAEHLPAGSTDWPATFCVAPAP